MLYIDVNIFSINIDHIIFKQVIENKADTANRTVIPISSCSQPAVTNFCTSTTTDDDFIWSTSLSDDNVTESSIDYLAGKADADRLDVLEKELAEDIGKLKQRAIMHLEDSSKRLQKYVDCIMAVFDDFVSSSSEKPKLSKRLNDVVTNQFGTSYVKDLFCSYSTAFDRNQLIFDLQLLRSYYFSDGLSRSPSNLSTQTEDIFVPPVKTKRKFEEGFYDEYDTGDEVTYLDK